MAITVSNTGVQEVMKTVGNDVWRRIKDEHQAHLHVITIVVFIRGN